MPGASTGLAEAAAGYAAGPNESVVLATSRLPGLVDPSGAYETGRALRLIARLLDRAGAPEAVGRQFRDNLAAAIVAHRARCSARPWGAADTVEMFMEIYGRVLGSEGRDFDIVRRTLLEYARGQTAVAPANAAVLQPRRLRRILKGRRAASL
jgi:hypothetical protein